ncbi:MAG: HAD family phosphatase [Isosphaeraceae bacterium]|nr:HAD family phosphatase [Isosphaeraceae bacterium]
MIRAVIFDFNGVIADDEHLHFELFREVLSQEGIELSEAKYHSDYLGFDDRGCFAAALQDSGRPADSSHVDALIARKAQLYATAAETELIIFPHAPEAVRRLAHTWPLAICSGALLPEIEFALARMNVRDSIGPIVSAEKTTACKPDPQGYLLALAELRARVDALAADECVVIEDSVAGIEAARAAGMHTIGITHTYSRDVLLAAGADLVVESPAELTTETIRRRFDERTS